ncbi:MAG: hypothetical protein QME63_04400 [Actinomycetota bacterium]|nr:hypothetical protein [Actinomycetota bacterium]
MKKALVVLMAAMLLVFVMAGIALAKDPGLTSSDDFTYSEKSGNVPPGTEYNALTPTSGAGPSGASLWSYGDTYGTTKYEGSYRAFDNQTNQLYEIPDALRVDSSARDSGPHGGYDTTTNKCKTCHAVHRATGTFALMRVDSPDQACEYCHVGDHRHSVVSAYWKAGTIYPANGHTIGADSAIPDSSVWQWEETINITLADGTTRQARKRHYNPTKNRIMRWTVHAGKWFRVGPISLRCQSCHQPHNAYRQVWKPAMSPVAQAKFGLPAGTTWSRGYKLLRNSPSGGIASMDVTGLGIKSDNVTVNSTADSRLNFKQIGEFTFDPRLKVVELATIDVRPNVVPLNDQSITATGWVYAGGVNRTGYVAFRYHSDNLNPGDANWDSYFSAVPVYETSLSFYCADCHNLNIAGKDYVSTELGVGKYGKGMLGDRSHAVPMMITGRESTTANANSGFHCYDCHNNDMPRTKDTSVKFDLDNDGVGETSMSLTAMGGDKTCANCHISPRNYAAYKQTYRQFQGVDGGPSYSDFPHSGPSTGYKLLQSVPDQGDAWDANDPTYEVAAPNGSPYTGGADALDAVCLICHGPEASRSVGYDK